MTAIFGLMTLGTLAAMPAHAMGNNDYTQSITLTSGAGTYINGLNVDRTTGQVYVAQNHTVRVFPAGVGGQAQTLEFPIDNGAGVNSSPSGVIFEGGKYYVSTYYRNGAVFSYDAQGQNQQNVFVVNDLVPYNTAAVGSMGIASNSDGDLIVASRNMPNPNAQPNRNLIPGLIAKGKDGTTRWKAFPNEDATGDVLQVTVDAQDNVYAAGDGFGQYVQVYDKAGKELRKIGPVSGTYSAGVAVDQCNFVYITSGSNLVEKFNPAGQRVASFSDPAVPTRSYISNRRSSPISVDVTGKHIYMIFNKGSEADYATWTQTTSPPPAPNVQATLSAAKEIQATWNQPAECISAYKLQISPDNGASWVNIALNGTTLDRTITTADTPLTAGTTYLLRTSATDPDGTSAYGPTASVTLPAAAPLPAPAISGTATNTPSINASWNAVSGATEYMLEVSADQASWTSITVPGAQTSRTITAGDFGALAPGKVYYLRVTAKNTDTASPLSNVATVTVPDAHVAPAPPAITATGNNQPPRVLAQWNAPAANISSYLLEVSDSSFTKASPLQITVPGTQTSREITAADIPGIAEGQTYYVRVSATSADGTSAFSQQASALIPVTPVNPEPPLASATPVPTLSQWGLMMLASLLGLMGMRRSRKP